MKKGVLSVLGLTVLAACSGYDYYETNVRYYQDGEDCVYYYAEDGDRFNKEIRSLSDAKKVVYRNIRCEDLYLNDSYGYDERNDRMAVIPAYVDDNKPAKTPCGCDKCGKKQVLKNKYVIVPALRG